MKLFMLWLVLLHPEERHVLYSDRPMTKERCQARATAEWWGRPDRERVEFRCLPARAVAGLLPEGVTNP
jgi:hypothetical protein